MNKKQVGAWALFDFANSVYPAVITTAVFSGYYTGFVVGGDDGRGTQLWGNAVSLSALIVALTAPLLGAIADRGGARKRFMLFYTGVCLFGVTLFATLDAGMALRGFILFVIANVGFESALVFYNSFLPDIAPPDKQGRISGLGFGVGYLGSAIGLMMAIPLVETIELVWLATAAFFLVFSIPAFVYLPKDEPGGMTVPQAAKWGLTNMASIVGEVWRLKDLRNFLMAFFFYIDGVLTIIVMAGPVAEETFGFGEVERIVLFLVVQFSALAGAFAMAKPTDVAGPKKVLNGVLMLWIVTGLAAFFVQSSTVFFGLAVVAGFGLGSVQSASRSYVSLLIPDGRESEMFGFYALCGKSSSVMGPFLFGTATVLAGGDQRPAFLVLTLLFVIGLVLLQRVPSPHVVGGAPEGS
ncbi:MAG: MFS transporter [Gemmatimonadetes bacterium]|nr:MFS transporter [Gemmatimonadota bacterium]NNF11855.1 MFS transporter [Gemmatimonadota bacterium]NNL31219.1 MFS transporter [Gemmatimonadota bacterium]